MRIRGAVCAFLACAGILSFFVETSEAQSTQGSRGVAPAFQIDANLAQLMRGIFFPNSNVIFAAQSINPDEVKPAKDPSTATDPLASTYGKWPAVENSGLAIAEAANLLMIPRRKCSNGRDVPIGNSDWAKLVKGVRDGGMTSYKAAQSKNQDNILTAADALATACANCHEKYRDTPELAGRCK